ncbi:hypothetical protein Q9233_010818 [Columba guinea]|nr:hypothetical protein Q9233_010818 [Columba guinea]
MSSGSSHLLFLPTSGCFSGWGKTGAGRTRLLRPVADSSRLLGRRRPGYGTLQPDAEKSRMEVTGYQTKRWRVALCHAGSVLTAGLLLVLFHWKPSLEVQAKCKPCALGQADWVIIRKNILRYYLFEGMRYVWMEQRQAFCKVRTKIYGPNLIEVPVKSYARLLVEEVLNPFYIFQVFSIVLWVCDAYYYYAACIFLISTISLGLSLYETRKQSATLQNMAKMSVGVRVRRPEGGDCISLPTDGTLVPCDAALLTGECMVNESMLTGFCTAKGDLISSILYPKPVSFKFYKDAVKFVLFLAVLGCPTFFFPTHQVPVGQIIIRALDLITVIVPPALPAAMTVGTIYAQNRLKKQGIFCISPPRINLCGKIRLVCFDKRLEMMEEEEGELPSCQQFGTKVLAVMKPPPEEEQPRDRKHQSPLGILRRFPFSSSLQRMSVLVKLPGEALAHVYTKGAPEMVAIPVDFSQMLRHYTTDGFRVLALACKPLSTVSTFEQALQLPRDSAESSLTFLGFLVMKNVLKPESAPVIHLLRNANIRPVMVTGDNMLTAVNVARSCRMVEAKEGVIFVSASPPGHDKPAALKFVLAEHSQGEEQLEILIRATVFARMSPDQKTQLVCSLQELK